MDGRKAGSHNTIDYDGSVTQTITFSLCNLFLCKYRLNSFVCVYGYMVPNRQYIHADTNKRIGSINIKIGTEEEMKKRQIAIAALAACLIFSITASADEVDQMIGIEIGTVSGGDSVSGNDIADSDDADTSVDYMIYRNQLNAQLADLQLEYLSSLEQEWEQKCAIEESKLELGYAIPVEVEEAKCQHTQVLLQIETMQDQQVFYKDLIGIYGGAYTPITVSETLPELGEYIWNNPAEEIYIKDLQLQYRTITREKTSLENQIHVMELKVQNAELLYEKGKSTYVQLLEQKNELMRLKVERMELIYDAHCIYYLLENGIMGQEV